MSFTLADAPATLAELQESSWKSKTVKQEVHDNFLTKLQAGEELYPGIIGFDSTVIPELNIAILAQHDILFLGEKGQAKSRLMRLLASFLDEAVPYLPTRQSGCTTIRSGRSPSGAANWWPTGCRKTFPSPGGLGNSGMPSGSPRAPSLPTSLAKSIRPSSPRA